MLETLQACFGANVSGNANRLALAHLNTNTLSMTWSILLKHLLQNVTVYIYLFVSSDYEALE